MAGPIPTKKIPELTAYGAPLNGAELLEVWSVNTSRRVPARDFVLPSDSVITVGGMGGALPGSRQLAGSSTINLVDNGAGNTLVLEVAGASAAALPGGLTPLAPAAGLLNNYVLAVGTGFLDIDTTAGAVDLTGVVPSLPDGQILIVSNTGSNLLQLMSQNINSNPTNRFRLAFDITLTQNASMTVRYSAAIGRWVQM